MHPDSDVPLRKPPRVAPGNVRDHHQPQLLRDAQQNQTGHAPFGPAAKSQPGVGAVHTDHARIAVAAPQIPRRHIRRTRRRHDARPMAGLPGVAELVGCVVTAYRPPRAACRASHLSSAAPSRHSDASLTERSEPRPSRYRTALDGHVFAGAARSATVVPQLPCGHPAMLRRPWVPDAASTKTSE